ncbi:MAG: tRNA (N(6)-L-threonylcarbamoyladenosine(37)-C(2))-methylthiotransferase [Thermoprotei archaeon]
MSAGNVSFVSFGCAMNKADSDSAKEYARISGLNIVEPGEAETVVVFSCSVRNETEDKIIAFTKGLLSEGRRVVVTSCLANSRPGRLVREAPGAVLMIGGDHAEILDAMHSEPGRIVYGRTRLQPSATPSVIQPVKIAQGCSSNCSFCITKLARPQLWSRPAREIIDTVQRAVKLGAVEIQLCSMDNADYFSPPNIRLPELVDMVVQNVEGNYMVRVGMMNPNGFERFADRLTDTLYQSQVYKFLHVPVQSGSPTIVEDMNRHYDPYKVALRILSFKEKLPETVMATDLMVGYPTEDEEAFERTLQLIKDVKPDIVNVSKFFARPKTAAAKMPNSVPKPEIKRRSSIAAELAKAIALERNQRWIGWSGEIFVDEVGKASGSWVGRNFAYKPIIIKSDDNLLGKTVKVKVVKAFSTYLEAQKVG